MHGKRSPGLIMKNVWYKKILNLLIVLHVFSGQRLSLKHEANPAHVGTRFPHNQTQSFPYSRGKLTLESSLGDEQPPGASPRGPCPLTSSVVALGTGSPGAARLAVSLLALPEPPSSSARELQQPHFTDGTTEAKANEVGRDGGTWRGARVPLGTVGWAAEGWSMGLVSEGQAAPPSLPWERAWGRARPSHPWSPTPEDLQAVAHRSIKGCSQAQCVLIGLFVVLL